jgi:diaminohydroxyphosphoribosylaminopyrimidine deaminase/5-amino-6-(5-phosphoribosylamino)uracil reductase
VVTPEIDDRFMRTALREARKGLGKTSPNPAVGAVLVLKNKIISRGHHRAAGEPHAEVECLRGVRGTIPRRAVMYLTLEPCSTVGRTGPCTNAIIRSGIKSAVVGSLDVNPRHRGRGIALLREAGIDVRVGILSKECSILNEAFNKWIVTRMPFVIAKCGMSLDGRLTRRSAEPRWITTIAARRHAHQLRATVDAILVGAETIRKDNPRLTVRGAAGAKQPYRVILTRSGKLPRNAQILRDRFKARTLIYAKQRLRSVLADLGRKDITSVLIEGGGEVLGEALDAGLIDKVQIYLGPILTGGPTIAFGQQGTATTQQAARVEGVSFTNIAKNICVTGYPKFPVG